MVGNEKMTSLLETPIQVDPERFEINLGNGSLCAAQRFYSKAPICQNLFRAGQQFIISLL